MKRTLLLIGSVAVVTLADAQCVPNQLYADSIYGVWPDTVENFTSGIINVFYTDTLNLLVPADAGLIDPDFDGFTIDSVQFDGVDGLPPGLSVICNSQTGGACTFLPDQVGCGLIEGTPTQLGTFEMTVNVTAFLYLGFVLEVPQSFSGYRITISEDDTGINTATITRTGVRNTPNPFTLRTNIEFSLNKAAPARVKVFNLVGEELWQKSFEGRHGLNTVVFEPGALQSGVYLYKVEVGAQTYTGRMILDR